MVDATDRSGAAMNELAPFALAELYRRHREALLTEYPDIDEATLADTLEGSSMLPDVIARLIRTARERDAHAEALKSMISDMQERKARFERGADRIRDMVLALMDAAGMKKHEEPDFTVSLRNNPPKVIISDEAELPDRYFKISRIPILTDIRSDLKNNIVIPGVSLSNGGVGLSLRVK